MQFTRGMMEAMSAAFAVRELIQNESVDFNVDEPYTYDSINLPDGYTKPSKEAYDEAFTRYLNIELFKVLREQRNKKLTESDFMMLSDYPKEDIEEWKVYRQALRDLPTNTEDPENPNWPTPPK
tara:strand:+ start:58 stop:429 length:372 start_codon:yes stop_codon:yes gene_type:complete